MESNELKIDLYPDNKPRYDFPKESVKSLITKDTLDHSLNKDQQLAYIYSNVPLLNGFYTAHNNHYPIRIKPDDIWLLIDKLKDICEQYCIKLQKDINNFFVYFIIK